MIKIKTPQEIAIMREGGKIAASVLRHVLAVAVPGKSLIELDKLADDLIVKAGANPSFKMEKGYSWATCMCLNNIVVHGIPTEYKLVNGDKLCVDLGVYYQGWHTDTAWTIEIKNQKSKIKNKDLDKFLTTGQEALEKANAECKIGNYIGDISAAMQKIVEGAGYSCVKQLVGHGVGRELHEDPEVPCYQRGDVKNMALLKEGMVLAVEVIYNMGLSPVVYKNEDGWTIVTKDGLPSAVFEHTVAVTKGGPQVLTA